jgi:Ca-activated chloride channel family protein
MDEPGAGEFILHKNDASHVQAPILDTDVTITISGLTARVRVAQTFKNDTPDWVEGIYQFPLPEKSSVDYLSMVIGDTLIEGEIKEKKQAKKLYNMAKKSGKKATLLQQHRPNIFSNSVANIAPYETIVVTIEYQQDLLFSDTGTLGIRFPMTITPRYSPSSKLIETFTDFERGFQLNPLDSTTIALDNQSHQSSNNVSIQVTLNSGIPLQSLSSPSHHIIHKQQSLKQHSITLDHLNYKADRDFVLNWKPLQGELPRAAAFSETINNETYLSLMVMPPKMAMNQQQHAREVIFVIDTSGSMAGESIRQAKAALLAGLNTLQAEDHFNLIEFDNSTRSLFKSAQPFDESHLRQAKKFIHQFNADGGTEMYHAMETALDNQTDTNRVRQVIFLTDGAISNEAQLFKLIKNQLGNSRLFTIGIGSAPNSFFMKRAAQFGRGSFTHIADAKQASQKISALFEKIQSPVVSNITINWPSHTQVEMWPNPIPDLFVGEPLWIKAKLSNPKGQVTINGQLADQLWQTQLPLNSHQQQPGIAKLWAREKIASIMNHSYHGRVNDKDKTTIIDTALEHQLVSRFTSLVAIDKTPSRIAESLKQKRIASMRPKGSSQALAYPNTAIDLTLTPLNALLLLLLSLTALFFIGRKH